MNGGNIRTPYDAKKATKSFKRFMTVRDDRLNGYGIKRDDSPLVLTKSLLGKCRKCGQSDVILIQCIPCGVSVLL